MGAQGVDLLMSPLARERLPLSIECKNTTKAPTSKDIEQSEHNAYKGTWPVVVWHPRGKDYKDSLVMMKFETLVKMISKLQGWDR
jgi:hypothetical protein